MRRLQGRLSKVPVPRVDVVSLTGMFFVVLLLSTDLTFRRRDPTLAVEGVLDIAIVLELAIWLAVAAWAALHLFPGARVRATLFEHVGPVLAVLLAVTGLFLLTSFYAGGALPVVRAGQFTIMVGMGLLAYQQVEGSPERAQRFWNAARRCLWISVALAVPISFVLGFVIPEWGVEIVPGEGPRYRLFRTHPITSGGLIGLAMVAMAGGYLASEDPWFARRRIRWFAGVVFAVLTVLLLATKARGSLFATLTALAVLIVLTHWRQRRGVAVLAALGASGMLLVGLGLQVVREIVIRGQTTDQLLSLTGRTRLFEVAYQFFLERPFVGHGYHAARSIFLERVPWAGHSHNAWVEVGVNTGTVGLVLTAFLFVRLGMRLWRARRVADLQQRGWAAEGIALAGFVLVLGMVSPGFAGAPGYELAALVWAVVLADLSLSRLERPKGGGTRRPGVRR